MLDLWFTFRVCRGCRGAAKLIRFADDYVVLFELKEDAERFAAALPERLAKFGLTLAEEKTKLIPFGRRHWATEQGRTQSFDFLGFRHHLGRDWHGRMAVVRIPSPKSVRKFLCNVAGWLREHLNDRPREQQRVLAQKLRGFYQYFALWHTTNKLRAVQREVYRYWHWALGRRSQKAKRPWKEWMARPWFTLPDPTVLHRAV